MSQNHRPYVKFKAFSKSPQLIQELADTLRTLYGQRITVSTIMPSAENDFYAYFTLFEGPQR